ncbi:hypothetical protein M3Y96_00411400 [Aphelenchoides besseyi]|nr:hypothetical protein M3Y96_00411400 [Aphelenchoides besseyi]
MVSAENMTIYLLNPGVNYRALCVLRLSNLLSTCKSSGDLSTFVAWNHTRYWKRRGVKGPPLLPFLGILDRFDRPEYPNVFVRRDWTKIYGSVYGIQKGWRNALVISDPALIHEMITEKFSVFHEHERIVQRGDPDKRSLTNLFSARGKRWKRLRTLSNPVFSVQNLKKILPTLEDSALETVRLLEKSSANGNEVDIHKFFHEYTMDTIARIAMGQPDSRQFQNDYTKILIDTFAAGNKWLNRLAWSFPALGPSVGRLNLLLGYWKQKGFAMLLQKTTKAVKERKAARAAGEIGEDSTDFIDFFLNAESDTVEYEVTGVYDKSNVHVNKRLTTDEVIAQCNVFLLSASYDDLNKMKYCEAVMKEVLRLHPIGTFAFARTAAETTTLGSVEVEKDTLIYVDVFSVHYDKKIWGEDADRFVPDRWFADHVPTAYYPFGGGPRVCIGMRLAYIEEKLALVHILRRFKIVECAATGDEPELRSNAVLNPTHITIKLEALLILVVIFIMTLLGISYWHTGYWQRRGIDGPPSRLFFGIVHKFGFSEYPNVFLLRDWTKEYGRVYGIQKGWKNVLVISDPEMVHEMMTEKFNVFHERERVPIRGDPDHEKMVNVFGARGKRWKRLRTLSNPVFSVQNLKKILPVLEDSARETTRLLEEASEDGRKALNIHPFSHEYTMDTIARIAMGQPDSRQFQNDYTKILIDTLNGRTKWIMDLSWAIPAAGRILAKLNLLLSRVKQRGPAMLLNKVNKAVEERKAARAADEIREDSTDFIDFFLNAESNDVEQEITGVYDKSNVHVSKRLTTQEIIASCNIFLIAGFDTTANTLSLSMFYLAKNPRVQERLFEEIKTCCPNADVSYEDLAKMKYCEALMKEVLRLHPIAAVVIGRTAAETTTLGSVEVEKGTIVLVDVFTLHYDKKIWGEDADRFVPDRWFADHVPTAYYPFGGGPRRTSKKSWLWFTSFDDSKSLNVLLRETNQILLATLFLIPITISWYHAGYYRRRGIPGPKSKPLIGALDQLGGPEKPNVLLLAEWTREYGRVYGFQKGWRNHLVISEPKMISEMMNEKFAYFHERETIPIRGNVDTVPMIHIFHARGKRWLRLRNLSTTIFSPQYLKKILPSLTQSADQIVSLLEKENGKPEVNVHPFFFEFTIDTICGIVLGNSARRVPFTNPYSRIIFDLLNEVNLWIVDLSWMFPYFAVFFSRLRMLYGMIKKSGLNELNTRIMKAVLLRKKIREIEGVDSESTVLIDTFLNFESTTIEPELTPGAFDGPRTAPKKEMTISECAANATAVMIAGFGTSSSTLALLCFYLAKHPEIQEKLREEFKSVCIEENVTYEELHSLPYADAVVKECLRLHPVGTFAFGRRCAKTTTLGSMEVERGTHVLLDVVSMQRDPEIWGANASSFIPDRWFEPDVPTYAYYPFGGGPRICPGRRLACLEIKLALLRLLQKFKVYEGLNMGSEPKLVGNLILFPEQINVRLKMQRDPIRLGEHIQSYRDVENQDPNGQSAADNLVSPQNNSAATRLNAMKKELEKELKVKEGLDRVLAAHAKNANKNANSLELVQIRSSVLAEDTRAKIAALRMKIDRFELSQNGEQDDTSFDSTEHITQDLLYRLYKEAQKSCTQSDQKVQLIRLALQKYADQYPPNSPQRNSVAREMDDVRRTPNARLSSPYSPPNSFIMSPTDSASQLNSSDSPQHDSPISSKAMPITVPLLPVSGNLEIQLIGCCDLLTDLPVSQAMTTPAKTNRQRSTETQRGITDEIYAALRLDNHVMAQTESKPAGPSCWNQQFSLELDRAKELEIEIYYRDGDAMCAFMVLRLGDYLDADTGIKTLPLEPQGRLDVSIRYLDPIEGRKRKLERQKQLFHVKKRGELLTMKNLFGTSAWARYLKSGNAYGNKSGVPRLVAFDASRPVTAAALGMPISQSVYGSMDAQQAAGMPGIGGGAGRHPATGSKQQQLAKSTQGLGLADLKNVLPSNRRQSSPNVHRLVNSAAETTLNNDLQQTATRTPLGQRQTSLQVPSMKSTRFHNRWEELLRKSIRPTFVPTIRTAEDVSNFDDEFTTENPRLSPAKEQRQISEIEQELFRGFDFSAAWHHTKYWKSRGISGPESEIFFGNLRQLGSCNAKPWPFTYREWTQRYGRYYGFQKGHRNCLVVSDPKMAHEVMVKEFEVFHERDLAPLAGNIETDPLPHLFMSRGQNWRRLRALSSPAFSVQSLKKILPVVEYCASETTRFLDEQADAQKSFNIHTYMYQYTIDVICRLALGQTDNKQFDNELTDIVIQILHDIEDPFLTASWMFPFLGEVLKWSQHFTAFFTKRWAFVKLIRVIQNTIEERKARRAAGDVREESVDFIDFFLDAESDEVVREYKEGVYDKKDINIVKKLSTKEVIGNSMVFLLAGFDTTANTLAFSTYYLAKHPAVQEKLRKEIEEICVKAVPTYEELSKLKYADAIMKETLRFHPIASIITSRKCVRDTMIGDVYVEKGTNVILDVLSLHFDKKTWGERANDFYPERWLQDDAPFSCFYGFGGGPRICAGMKLAYLEQKLLLVHILRKFLIVATPETPEHLEITDFIMKPKHVTIKLQHLEK